MTPPTTNPPIAIPLDDGLTLNVAPLEMYHLLKLREKMAAFDLALIWSVKPDDMQAFEDIARRNYTLSDISRYAETMGGMLELCGLLVCDANSGMSHRAAIAAIVQNKLAARIIAAARRLPDSKDSAGENGSAEGKAVPGGAGGSGA